MLAALTRKFQLGSDVQLEEIAGMCSEKFSGADLYALCTDAWMNAAKSLIHSNRETGKEVEDQGVIVVRRSDFIAGLRSVRASLSDSDISKKYSVS